MDPSFQAKTKVIPFEKFGISGTHHFRPKPMLSPLKIWDFLDRHFWPKPRLSILKCLGFHGPFIFGQNQDYPLEKFGISWTPHFRPKPRLSPLKNSGFPGPLIIGQKPRLSLLICLAFHRLLIFGQKPRLSPLKKSGIHGPLIFCQNQCYAHGPLIFDQNQGYPL